MEYNSYKSASVSKEAAKEAKAWVVVDAEGQILGRMCTKVAKLLRGKYKPSYTPNVDCGDNVIIINAAKVQLTGNKWNDRVYVRYTGFPGGQREFTPADLMAKGAEKLVRKVVKGMLPKNRLGSKQINNLFIFEGPEHDKQAQKPVVIDINTLK
ncbi:MAG: 50S ribosomal protein L13 [Paludibacteraceae bacterium]|nr:50S ribosomal protein L13 [Paludibacteraceae bacterium]